MNFLAVGAGGFLGACSRYLLTKLLEQHNATFSFGTLLSNVIAALIIGFIIGMERQYAPLPENTKLFLTTGLLGGLSTFSTFSLETVQYFESGKHLIAAGNILLNVALSLCCVLLGLAAAKALSQTLGS